MMPILVRNKFLVFLSLLLLVLKVNGQDTIAGTDFVIKYQEGGHYLGYKAGDSMPFTGYINNSSDPMFPDVIKCINGVTIKQSYVALNDYSNYDTLLYSNNIIKEIKHYDSLGNLDGKYFLFDSLGRIKMKGDYTKGMKNGFWYFFEEGIKRTAGLYYNDIKAGLWNQYNDKGDIIKSETYINGRLKTSKSTE